MTRKVTVQLTFKFPGEFSDAACCEHIDMLLHRSICDIDEQLLRVLSRKPKDEEAKKNQRFALKFYQTDKKRLKAALKTCEVIQIEG